VVQIIDKPKVKQPIDLLGRRMDLNPWAINVIHIYIYIYMTLVA